MVKYQPKGGMCATCVHSSKDCSKLPFHTYRVLEYLEEGDYEIRQVKCKKFQRRSERG